VELKSFQSSNHDRIATWKQQTPSFKLLIQQDVSYPLIQSATTTQPLPRPVDIGLQSKHRQSPACDGTSTSAEC
jgi:hypothetical protein